MVEVMSGVVSTVGEVERDGRQVQRFADNNGIQWPSGRGQVDQHGFNVVHILNY